MREAESSTMRKGLFVLLLLLGGCAMHQRVQNPFPGVFRVAVVPFVDKSNGAEGLDTLKVTEMFASELQKIPTYEVVPVQEVREVLRGQVIDTNQPELAFALARSLHVQAIIVGAVTEFETYYPPQLGLHCEMYAMVTGEPELVVQTVSEVGSANPASSNLSEYVPRALKSWVPPALEILVPPKKEDCAPPAPKPPPKPACPPQQCDPKIGCRAPGFPTRPAPRNPPLPMIPIPQPIGPSWDFSPSSMPIQGIRADQYIEPEPPAPGKEKEKSARFTERRSTPPVIRPVSAESPETSDEVGRTSELDSSRGQAGTPEQLLAGQIPVSQLSTVRMQNPTPVVEPWVLRHSRIFDAGNLGFAYKLSDYYFFRKDLRGGDWIAYSERTDDFIRFSCNRMIYEMLESAGGRWSTLRGVRVPKPWLPWPWR